MKQIIIAEDDPGIRDICEMILKRAGYMVTAYPNGDILMHNDFKIPDMFILDKQLSGVDGLEVCRYLKQQESTKDIPVVIMSASPYLSGNSEAAGANDFLEKPFKTKELLEILKKHLETE